MVQAIDDSLYIKSLLIYLIKDFHQLLNNCYITILNSFMMIDFKKRF